MPSKSYTLVVVDMQSGFDTSFGALNGCIREVQQAVIDKAGIIFLEYHGFYGDAYGFTLPQLKALVDGYSRAYYVPKGADDGSIEVVEAIEKYRMSKLHIKVCGVNTDACVLATVQGLIQKCDKVYLQVIADACNGFNNTNGFNSMLSAKKYFPNKNNNNIKIKIANWVKAA
jgi:nicotinamidase-related amidase